MRRFEPQPEVGELPTRFPSPFATGAPVAIARRAADELRRELAFGLLPEAADGKMFGVLVVVAPDGAVGALRAFSGMVGGRWHVDGFAPPLFDFAARQRFWPAGEAELGALDAQRRELASSRVAQALRADVAALARRQEDEMNELRARHRAQREARHRARGALAAEAHAERRALDQASRTDGAERRRCEVTHREEREVSSAALRELEARLAELDDRRARRSHQLLQQIWDTYIVENARGERTSLRDLFAPADVPGGAGDCAAPKLLAEAYRGGSRPVALAEFWWGATPAAGGRHAGSFYPACRGKCGGLLPYMLEGLAVEEAPAFGGGAVSFDEPAVVFEDAWLIIVDKPVGLLSVPGRRRELSDSVQNRLRARAGGAERYVVHRLDLDTSGLMIVAKDVRTHAALQQQFAQRLVDKRYVAWVDGVAGAERGTIDLALRVDLDDRPRQIHDEVHGRPAFTEWRAVARTATRTRVELVPRTGRTHQLRVHAAHPRGLGAPIVGDRLYGRSDDGGRLLLHAEALGFAHPHTGARVAIERPAPF